MFSEGMLLSSVAILSFTCSKVPKQISFSNTLTFGKGHSELNLSNTGHSQVQGSFMRITNPELWACDSLNKTPPFINP